LIIDRRGVAICGSNQRRIDFPNKFYLHQLQNLYFALTNRELELQHEKANNTTGSTAD
jgi:hypothetical protein